MIRRAFWLGVGAAGGIMGYRRATALGRRIAGNGGATRTTTRMTTAAGRGWVRGAIRASRDARAFSRDVREGMDLYMARRPRAADHTLGSSVTKSGSATKSTANHDDVNVKDDRDAVG